jgi:hypothetical protein
MQIHPLIDPYAIHYTTFAGDVYTLDTASITLTAGTLTANTITDGTLSISGGNLTTTGTGRFDGGIGVGTAPSYALHIDTGEVNLTGTDGAVDTEAPAFLTALGGTGGAYSVGPAGKGASATITSGVGGTGGSGIDAGSGGDISLITSNAGASTTTTGRGGDIYLTTGAGSMAGQYYGNVYLVKDGGYVGIANITPTYELDITGDLAVSQYGIFPDSVIIGDEDTPAYNLEVYFGDTYFQGPNATVDTAPVAFEVLGGAGFSQTTGRGGDIKLTGGTGGVEGKAGGPGPGGDIWITGGVQGAGGGGSTEGSVYLSHAQGYVRIGSSTAPTNLLSIASDGKIDFRDSAIGAYSQADSYLDIFADGGVRIGDSSAGAPTNYSKFEADGTLEFNGTATVWNDANMGAGQLALPVASQPDEDNFLDEGGGDTGITTWAFAVGEKVSGSIEIPHDYKEGSDITFHIHWQGIAAPTGTDYVKWQCTYSVAQSEATLDAATSIVIETAFDTQYEFKVSSCPAITGTNFNIGDQFIFTLERIAAAGDAYAGDALVATVGIHYECDTVGSRAIITK